MGGKLKWAMVLGQFYSTSQAAVDVLKVATHRVVEWPKPWSKPPPAIHHPKAVVTKRIVKAMVKARSGYFPFLDSVRGLLLMIMWISS
jgi:hypothetical protein